MQRASLYLGSQSYQQILVVSLNQPNFQAYHTQVRLNIEKGNTQKLKSTGGSIYVIGYFTSNQHSIQISQTTKDSKNIKNKLNSSQKDEEEKGRKQSFAQVKKQQKKGKQEKNSTKNKNTDNSKNKSASKGKYLLDMMNDLDDDDDEDESDYQQQEQSSSSSSESSQDSDETPPVSKKQAKQIKSDSKQVEISKSNSKQVKTTNPSNIKKVESNNSNKRDEKNQSQQIHPQEIDRIRIKLLEIYPNLQSNILALAYKIVGKCIADIGPFPSSLLQSNQSNSTSENKEKFYWQAKLNHSILLVQQEICCKDTKQKEQCMLKKQQLESLISKYEKSQFQYRIPTTLPSFVLKK